MNGVESRACGHCRRHGRNDGIAIRGEGLVFAVVLQVHGELIDAETFQLPQSSNMLINGSQQAKAVDDLVRNELGVTVAGAAVLVVVVALPVLDVFGQSRRHL